MVYLTGCVKIVVLYGKPTKCGFHGDLLDTPGKPTKCGFHGNLLDTPGKHYLFCLVGT